MKLNTALLLATQLLMPLVTHAEIHTETVLYKQGDATLEGYLAYDTKKTGKRPGILIVHDWMGPSAFTKDRAEQLAKMGFVAFAADIYGQGVRPKNADEAGKIAGGFKKDRPLLRQRALAAYEILKGQKVVDKGSLAVMGYCFGGTTALELGRAGADLKGIVSFHGGLDNPNPQDSKNIKGKVLVLHGADDPYVPADQVKAFEEEMRAAQLDWELVKYSKAVHAFAVPSAGNDNSKGAAYNAEADHRSWIAMHNFLDEIFTLKK